MERGDFVVINYTEYSRNIVATYLEEDNGCREAEKALYEEEEKERLESLSDINNLLDELYVVIKDNSNHARLYGEVIKRFKTEMRK